MRRLTGAVALAIVAIAVPACKRGAKPRAAPELLSVVPMDDPHANAQLVSGFYSLEGNPWRWTAGKFSAILKPPPGAALEGAKLELKLNIPDLVIQQLGAVTLSASANGSPLPPETYARTGDHVYAPQVPADVLGGGSVTIEFATDKVIPAGKVEKRELALIVTSVGLIPK